MLYSQTSTGWPYAVVATIVAVPSQPIKTTPFKEIKEATGSPSTTPQQNDTDAPFTEIGVVVAKVIEELFDEETEEEAAIQIQVALRQGNAEVADEILAAIDTASFSSEDRALAFEAFTAARSDHFLGETTNLVAKYLGSRDRMMMLAAVAACSDLPPSARAALLPAIRQIRDAEETPKPIRAAAAAFTRWQERGGS